MSKQTYEPPSSPLSIGGILDDGFRLFKFALRPLFALAFLTALAQNMPNVLVGSTIDPETGASSSPILLLVTTLGSIILFFALFCALVVRVDDLANGRDGSLGKAFGIGLRRAAPMFLMGCCGALAIGGGLILLVVPGLILAVTLSQGAYVMILEGKGPIQSLRDSHNLVWGYFWRTATVMTIAAVIGFAFLLLSGFATGLLLLPMVDDPEAQMGMGLLVTSTLMSSLLTAVFLPLSYCLFYSVYRDLKLRREGQDLVERIEAVEA